MKIAIMTIPHTGTHFVLNLLGGTRDNLADWMNKKFDANGHSFYVSHTYRLPIFEMMESEGYTIVSSLRHPITTVKSWHDQYTKTPLEIPEDVDDTRIYPPHIEKYVTVNNLPNLYKGLIMASQLYDINFIPIDSPKREEFLEVFNMKYGLDLKTEWRPLNSHGEHTLDIPSDLLDQTNKMMKENKEFFDRFYD